MLNSDLIRPGDQKRLVDSDGAPQRVQFAVYKRSTGEILRTGICAATDLHLQPQGEDEDWLGTPVFMADDRVFGWIDDERHQVCNGQITLKAEVAKAEAAAAKAEFDQRTARSTAAAYLAATDWMVIRQSEAGKPVPDDILQARAEARVVLSS